MARTESWTLLPSMLQARTMGCAVAVKGCVLAIGGQDGGLDDTNNQLHAVEVFNPASEVWSSLPPMSYARTDAGACSLNGEVFVVGGSNSENEA